MKYAPYFTTNIVRNYERYAGEACSNEYTIYIDNQSGDYLELKTAVSLIQIFVVNVFTVVLEIFIGILISNNKKHLKLNEQGHYYYYQY